MAVSETLDAPTGALNTVQAEGAVRCTIRCDVQLPVSKTLDAPTGARNTVQATGAVRCTIRCDVQLQVSETLNASTGARNIVQAIGAVRCTIRCDVQLPVSETLNAPTGAHNTVQAEGAVRCRQRNPPVCLSETGDKVKYRPTESAAQSSDVASLREAGGWVHSYTTLRLRLVWCYARLRRGAASPRLCRCCHFAAICVWWFLTEVRYLMMPVAVSKTLNAPTKTKTKTKTIKTKTKTKTKTSYKKRRKRKPASAQFSFSSSLSLRRLTLPRCRRC